MSSLRAFIADRRAEITRQIDMLRAELRDLDKAEAALADHVAPREAPSAKTATLKGMALAVLRQQPSGIDANQVLKEIERSFGVKVERSSLSPQLSRLKHDGILAVEGKIWRRTGDLEKEARYLPPPKENEPSDIVSDGSEARSKDGSDPSQEHTNQSAQDIFS